MHVVAVELIAKLADAIAAVEAHLSGMDCVALQALEAKLPRTAPAGSAEMVILVLIYREMEKRNRA
ncbi:hypothetical protein ACVOMV_18600 [Mesorhizobium atlanticum]